jgi:short-subunit dehydrogenase
MISTARYGPWALITGGSEGLGASFAHRLAEAGFNLVLVARREEPLAELTAALRAEHRVEVRTLAADLTRTDVLDEIRSLTDDVEVGLLICNAGGAVQGSMPFLAASLEDNLKVVQLNPIAQTALCHHFGKRMEPRRRGGIILVGSLAGNAGGPTVVAYSAAKAFTQILAEGLWCELQPLGIDVLCTVLGATDTPARSRMGFADPEGAVISSPDDIARDALANLANGPVYVPQHLEPGFRHICSLPRREAAETMRSILSAFDPT